MVRRTPFSLLSLALLALALAPLTGCDAVGPDGASAAETALSAPAHLEDCAPDDIDCETRGGGGTGGGTPVQYRISTQLGVTPTFGAGAYQYVDVEAFTRHERQMGGSWVKVDGQNNGLICYVNGYEVDRDIESSAGYTDVSFRVWASQWGLGFHRISCSHFSTSPNGVTHNETRFYDVQFSP